MMGFIVLNERLETFAMRLKAAVQRFGGNKAAADASGVPLSTLNTYLAGTSDPKLTVIARLAEALGTSIPALLGSENQIESTENQIFDESVFIPLMSVQAGAGAGIVNGSVEEIARLPFSRAMLRHYGVKPENAHFIRISGDSMFPTLQDGGVAIVDASKKLPQDGLIYAFVLNNEVVVKRFQAGLRGSAMLISDNPRYAPLELTSADEIRVEGRVFFAGGGL